MSTIWEAALEEVNIKKESETYKGIVNNRYILIAGGKSSGKSTAILRFQNRDEQIKSTVALEYTYVKKSQMQDSSIGHIWELGGGTFLSKLLDVPLNADTINQMTVVIVLDLSKPSTLWYTAESLIEKAKTRLNIVVREESRKQPNFQGKIEEKAWARLGGKDHPDSHMIKPFPVPLVIIGSKYDVYQNMESEERKVITKTMRFLAHVNGALLLYMSKNIESTVRALKHVMNHAAFGIELNTKPIIDTQKPLYIPSGMDTFSGIGNPVVASSEIGRLSSRDPMDMWRTAFCGHFPQEGDDKKNLTKAPDPAKDEQFAEPLLDEARAQKDKELEAYRRQQKNKWTKM